LDYLPVVVFMNGDGGRKMNEKTCAMIENMIRWAEDRIEAMMYNVVSKVIPLRSAGESAALSAPAGPFARSR
jgi:hypothetical protein